MLFCDVDLQGSKFLQFVWEQSYSKSVPLEYILDQTGLERIHVNNNLESYYVPLPVKCNGNISVLSKQGDRET